MPWTTVESAGLSPLLRGVLSWKPPSRGALRPVAKSPVSSLGVIRAWRGGGGGFANPPPRQLLSKSRELIGATQSP